MYKRTITSTFLNALHVLSGPGSDWLRAGRSGDRIPVGARFSAPVQTGPGAHPGSCTMGTVSFPGVKSGRGVTLTPHPLLVPWSRKSTAIPLLPLRAVRPVQSLSTRTRCTLPYFILHSVYCISCCSHAAHIFPRVPALHKRMNRPGLSYVH